MKKQPAKSGAKHGKASTQWKPGQSGNPAGKPPGTLSITTHIKNALAELVEVQQKDGTKKKVTKLDMYIQRIMNKAIGEGNDKIIRLMWNYIDGMPKQDVDLKTTGNLQINLMHYGTHHSTPLSTEGLPASDSESNGLGNQQGGNGVASEKREG